MRRFFTLIALSLLLASGASIVGCSDDGHGGDRPDASGSDIDQEDVDQADGEGSDTDQEEDGSQTPTSCEFQADCASADKICVDGTCLDAPECAAIDKWSRCVSEFEEIEPGLGRRAVCDEAAKRCRVACLLDEHCADGEICSDGGHCIEFTGEITGEAPGGEARAPLKAGVANHLMHFPIGLSQGGYGSRMAIDDGRYVASLQATAGQMHGLFARAFVLDNGERQLMFLRLPTVFPSMALHEALARKLQELTGKDWRESLVLSSTHTHSGPTRFWQLPTGGMVPMGMFGTDEFSQQVFDWMVETTFEAAREALDDLAPARFGWTVLESYDTDDRIASDRWKATPPFDDNRALLFRIDDADGTPRAVVMSYGSHGTVHSDRYFTGDAPMGAERGVERALAAEFGEYVPVMFFSSNGGTMSPRGDHWGHEELERFESLGDELAERLLPAIRDIQTDDDLALEAVTHRFPITYEIIGYGPDEWQVGRGGRGTPNNVFDFGALSCLDGKADEDPATYFTPPVNEGCLPIHELNHHRPVSLFARSQTTSLKLGDLTIITLPGEASMEIGWQVTREARDQFGLDPFKTWVMGYAQDHQFYLTPTNLRGELPPYPGISTPKALDEYPDYAFSWLQGGYEAGLSVWGWKFGDFMVERALEGLAKLVDAPVQPAFDSPLPLEYSRVDETAFPIESSDAAQVGQIIEEPPAELTRLSAIEFAWVGGDPGAEMPQAPRVELQRKTGDTFEAARTLSQTVYDNREPVMLTRVRKNGDAWEWVVYWEELQQFELGEYRFKVEGHYQNDAQERVSYEATSRTFELIARDDLMVELDAESDDLSTIAGTLGYPAGESLKYKETRQDLGAISGNFRMRHPRVALGHSAPLITGEDIQADQITVTLTNIDDATQVTEYTGADIESSTDEEQVNGRDGVPVTRFSIPSHAAPTVPGTYEIAVSVTDAWGNTGEINTQVTVD